MPERLECEVLQKACYINTLTFTFTFYSSSNRELHNILPMYLIDAMTNKSCVGRTNRQPVRYTAGCVDQCRSNSAGY